MKLTALTKFSEKDLKPGEKVILMVRRHWVAFFYNTLRPLFITLSVTFVIIIAILLGILGFAPTLENFFIWFIYFIFLIYMLGVQIAKHYIDWRYDVDILTNLRLIDLDQNYLFGRDIGITDLDSIEDVSVRHEGLLSTMFDYGDIDVQTAGTTANKLVGGKTFVMEKVPHPTKIQSLIYESMAALRKHKYKYNENPIPPQEKNFNPYIDPTQPTASPYPPPPPASHQTPDIPTPPPPSSSS